MCPTIENPTGISSWASSGKSEVMISSIFKSGFYRMVANLRRTYGMSSNGNQVLDYRK
jgi:hypothetical protein